MWQARHPAIERQSFQTVVAIVVGDEPVEQSGAVRRVKCLDHARPTERSDQAAAENVDQARASIGLGYAVVMLDGHVGFTDDLVGGENFGSGILNEPVSLATQYSKSEAGSPVSRRTRMEVSIPKRRVKGLLAEGMEVEGSVSGL